MTEGEARRVVRFPDAVENTMRKIKALENEARRYGYRDILTRLEAVNEAWEREVMLAYARNTERDVAE